MNPVAPVVGVGGVVIRDGEVLLIRRGKPPLYGRWVVPGGTVELGEPLERALVRELQEETGLVVEPLELLTVFDRIERDGEQVVYHYVIVDYLCRWLSGKHGPPRMRWRSPGPTRPIWAVLTCPRRPSRWSRTPFDGLLGGKPQALRGFRFASGPGAAYPFPQVRPLAGSRRLG